MRDNYQFVDIEDDIVTRIEEHLHGGMKKTSEFLLTLAADEIERLRTERDHYWATTNEAVSERNRWVRLFKLAFDSHFDKIWDGETADLLGQAYDEAECICGDDKL